MATVGPRDYSPFTPGQPVPPDHFVGRRQELEALLAKVWQSGSGRVQVAFVSGERGIGKSSLAAHLASISERDPGAVAVQVFLGGVASVEESIRRILEAIARTAEDQRWYDRIADRFKRHVTRVGLFGVSIEFGARPDELRAIASNFPRELLGLVERLPDARRRLLIVMDDINGLAASQAFADWLKSFVDTAATSSGRLPLCLLLAGVESRRQSLLALQPSLARVLDVVAIEPWSPEETREFFTNTFRKVGIAVDPSALAVLESYAGGLPTLAQELGDAAFKLTNDERLSEPIATSAIVAAADVVGRKYLEPQVFQAIRSVRYREILHDLARLLNLAPHFNRKDVIRTLDERKRRVFDNFLRKMRELEIIQQDRDAGPGSYRFVTRLHLLYFHIEALRADRMRARSVWDQPLE